MVNINGKEWTKLEPLDIQKVRIWGSGSASSKGRAIRQVEILSNKLLTTAFEASLEFVAVM